jgi:threonine dehydrogenase-like Zn-dependent dehydrogenase
MKAVAVIPDEKKLSLIDHPEPDVSDTSEVKLRMLEVGVCGTDREISAFEYGTPPKGSKYLIIGHESLGQVVSVGKDVTRVKPGDLAVMSVRRPCPELCPACAVGRQDFCYTGDYEERGIVRRHGYMTEFVVEEERYVHHVPTELREFGVLTEPLTIAEKAFDQIEKVQLRMPWTCPDSSGRRNNCHTAVVLGAGPVGLLGAMKLVIEGFKVFVYSRGLETEKPPLVEAMGATFVPSEKIKPKDLSKACGGGIDVVYEAMGAPGVAFDVIQELGMNAIFVFTGVPGHQDPMPVNTSTIMRDMVLRNQLVLGTVNASPQHFDNAIADLGKFDQQFPDVVRKLITKRFPIDDYEQPIAGHEGIKNVIEIAAA